MKNLDFEVIQLTYCFRHARILVIYRFCFTPLMMKLAVQGSFRIWTEKEGVADYGTMAGFNYQRPYSSLTQPRGARMDGLNVFSALSAQLETLSRRLDVVVAQHNRRIAVTCNYCAGNHPSNQCTISLGSVQYGGNYLNNYSYPIYHQVWGYHLDSSWSYNYQDQYSTPNPTYTPELSYQPPLKEEKSKLEELLSKVIANQEERIMSQEISSHNFQHQMEQLITTSTHGPQYMDSKTETDNSRLEELLSKLIANQEERRINQERSIQNQEISIQNMQNQMDQMLKALNNCPQNNWCYDEDSEIDEVSEPNLQLDDTRDFEKEETSGGNENKVSEELTVGTNDDEPMLFMPQVPSSLKFKDPVRFAKSCPLGSHVVDKALYDMRASATMKPRWDEKKKINEEPIVFATLPCPNMITNTMEIAPSYFPFFMEILLSQSNLDDFDAMAIACGNLPKDYFATDGWRIPQFPKRNWIVLTRQSLAERL